MNINQLYSFIALCDQKNISATSKNLNISQQGLSRQIQSLEKELEGTLFERNHTGVFLTDFGEEVLPYLVDSIKNYEKIMQISASHNNSKNNIIKLAFAQGVTSAIGVEFILEFNKQYPNTHVEILEFTDEDCYNALISEDVDFAFMIHPFNTSKIIHTPVYKDSAYVVVNNDHKYAKTKTSLNMKDLNNEPLFLLDDKCTVRKTFNNLCESLDIKPDIVFSANTIVSYLNLCNNTLAMAVIMGFLIPYTDPSNVTILPLIDGPEYNVSFCENKQSSNSTIKSNLCSFVKSYFNNQTY